MPRASIALAAALCCAAAAGCARSAEPSEPPLVEPPPPELAFVTAALTEAPVRVPCDEVRTVWIENRSDREHRIDALSLGSSDERMLGLATVLELPRIVRPGGAMEVPIRVSGQEAGVAVAELEAETDIGPLAASATVEVGFADERDEAFVTPLPAADIVLAVDRSPGMAAGHEQQLVEGAQHLIDALDAAADWRLALVTADDGCSKGDVLAAGDAGAADFIAEHAFDAGGGTQRAESLLELASVALSQNGSNECNRDLQRPGAQLHVIAISDADEGSGRSWSWWVDDYLTYADEVRVSAVADVEGRCGEGADSYADAADATDGVLLDICDGGWGSDMGRLADAIDALPPRFTLARPAVADSIVATIDGAVVAASYDAEAGQVIVPAAAEPGTAVAIRYGVPEVCAAER